MKTKLLSVLLTTVLSTIGFSAMADEVVDTSACEVVVISKFADNMFIDIKALRCPHISSGYVIRFYTSRNRCALMAIDSTNYRVEGTCKDYILYRKG